MLGGELDLEEDATELDVVTGGSWREKYWNVWVIRKVSPWREKYWVIRKVGPGRRTIGIVGSLESRSRRMEN